MIVLKNVNRLQSPLRKQNPSLIWTNKSKDILDAIFVLIATEYFRCLAIGPSTSSSASMITFDQSTRLCNVMSLLSLWTIDLRPTDLASECFFN